MSSRMARQPGHRHSGDRLREVVATVVPEEDCARYLPFARELYATFRHKPQAPSRKLQAQAQAAQRVIPTKRSAWRNLAAEDRRRDPSTSLGVTEPGVRPPRFPDFSRRTKLVVMRWFARGLHGKAMWLIGERLLGRIHPAPQIGRSPY